MCNKELKRCLIDYHCRSCPVKTISLGKKVLDSTVWVLIKSSFVLSIWQLSLASIIFQVDEGNVWALGCVGLVLEGIETLPPA